MKRFQILDNLCFFIKGKLQSKIKNNRSAVFVQQGAQTTKRTPVPDGAFIKIGKDIIITILCTITFKKFSLTISRQGINLNILLYLHTHHIID